MPEDPYSKFHAAQAEAERIYQRDLRRINNDMATFQSILEKFAQYPIVCIDQDDAARLRGYNWDIHVYIEALCKEKRYTYIELVKHYNNYTLVVPTRRGTSGLVASLLVIAKPKRVVNTDIVTVLSRPRSWTFTFHGDEGKNLLLGWIEQCKADPINQVTLGFGPIYDDARIRHAPTQEESDDAGS
jgi:hypothetical protein